MGLGDRIKAARKKCGKTQAAIGELIGVKNYVIADWENGRSSPGAEILPRLAEACECSLWDFMGPPDDPRERGAVPIYKSIRCGDSKDGLGVTGEIVGELPFDHATVRSGVFGIIAKGDSMWGPSGWIQDGAWVLFQPCQPDFLPDGKICCLTVEGYADPLCKRIRLDPTGLVLASDNPSYPPIFIKPGQRVINHGTWFGSWVPAPRNGVHEPPEPYGGGKMG